VRNLKILVVTAMMTLMLAAPAFAQVFGDDNAVANNGGFVAINSDFNFESNTININGDNNLAGIDSFNVTGAPF
jgi:hypothetical protein